MCKYCGIVINNESDMVDKIFTYMVPENMVEKVKIGHRVKVPFGKGNKNVDGFVLSIFDSLDNENKKIKYKFIEKICDDFTLFNENDVKIMHQMKERFLCSFLDCIKVIMPSGALKGLKHKTVLKLYICKELENKYSKEPYKNIYETIKNNDGTYTASELNKNFSYSISSIKTLKKHGFIIESTEKINRYDQRLFKEYKAFILNDEQEIVFNEVISSKKNKFLIHGITGSGKTEIYLKLVEYYLAKGKESIVLVPEISLTPQMVERFKGRFGSSISVFHSRLSEGEKFDEWMRVKNKEVKIAIGARSAIFLPFENLGLIVIDEEHENSYKSEFDPKYHAVEVGEIKAHLNDIKLVLGSATPSIGIYHRSIENEFKLLKLTNRALSTNTLPETKVIDMREELKNNNRSMFSNVLLEEIEKNINNKDQTILFLNRRGFSTFVSCRSCGYVFKCDTCDISLTYYQKNNKMVCNYCGKNYSIQRTCPKCKSKYVKYFGVGTEKVEEEIKKYFPSAKVLRMDFDTTRKKDAYEKIYHSFKNNEANILIGTQMVAKGLDFKNVTLVGVLAADISLNLPDFRASEKTFQLITQVSGRAGRGVKAGRVIIQTYNPEHYSLIHSSNQDYVSFFKEEIKIRKAMGYPPFGKLMNIIFSHKDENILIKGSHLVAVELEKNIKDSISILGPCGCTIIKIKELYRYQILLKGDISFLLALNLKKIIYNIIKKYNNEIKISIDINPLSLI